MASPGLVTLAQDDFAAGMVRAFARHLIPPNGAFDMPNMLVDDDGSAYKRAGCEYQSTADFSSGGLRSLWDVTLPPGQRTLFASSARWGVLGGDDATPVDLGAGGVAAPTHAVEVGGVLFIDGGTAYAGSRVAGTRAGGTLSLTNGSATVTGSGTAFVGLDAGSLVQIAGERLYIVASVGTNTQLTLTEPYQGTTRAGVGYAISALAALASPYPLGIYGWVAGRLLCGVGNLLRFSNTLAAGGGPHVWGANDYHVFPQSAQIIGVEGIRDTAIVFTTQGMWTIANMALEENDLVSAAPQHRVERVNPALILWGKEGVASWANALIVPATDGLWLIDPQGSPVRLSNAVTPLWQDYVARGYRPGLATVYRNHYYLPVLDTANVWVDTLVCRLDRPTAYRGITFYPFTRFDAMAGEVCGYVTRTPASGPPRLIGGSRRAAGRLLRLRPHSPDASRAREADGSTFTFGIVARDQATGDASGQRNENVVKRVRVRMELRDAASDDPGVSLETSDGTPIPGVYSAWGTARWGTGTWSSTAAAGVEWTPAPYRAPESDGRKPFTWRIHRRARFIRARLLSSDPAASMALRSLEYHVRPSARNT